MIPSKAYRIVNLEDLLWCQLVSYLGGYKQHVGAAPARKTRWLFSHNIKARSKLQANPAE
jgi:hypothetical protein